MHGLHLTADLHGCGPARSLMTDAAALRDCCVAAVGATGLRAVGELFHRFEPLAGNDQSTGVTGVTGMVLLAESHLAIHTWPEIGVVTLDVYVCNRGTDNSAQAEALMQALLAAFAPARSERHALRRGRP